MRILYALGAAVSMFGGTMAQVWADDDIGAKPRTLRLQLPAPHYREDDSQPLYRST